MKKQSRFTAFYLETLILIVVFIAIILVLTQVFGLARVQSVKARQLTDAVVLAGNAAEAVSASRTEEELLELLNERDNAIAMPDDAGITARYDERLQPDASGGYRVDVSWVPEETETGTMIRSVVEVHWNDGEIPIYLLETEAFKQAETEAEE